MTITALLTSMTIKISQKLICSKSFSIDLGSEIDQNPLDSTLDLTCNAIFLATFALLLPGKYFFIEVIIYVYICFGVLDVSLQVTVSPPEPSHGSKKDLQDPRWISNTVASQPSLPPQPETPKHHETPQPLLPSTNLETPSHFHH